MRGIGGRWRVRDLAAPLLHLLGSLVTIAPTRQSFFPSSCPCWAQPALFSSLSPSAPRVVRAFPCWRSQVPQHPVCFPDHEHKISPLDPLPSRCLLGAWSSHLLPPLLRACPHILPDTWFSLGERVVVLSCAPQISLVRLQYSPPSGWGYLCSQLSPPSGISLSRRQHPCSGLSRPHLQFTSNDRSAGQSV